VHPYRKPASDRAASAPSEELILYVALCAIGAIPVVTTLVRGGAFGVEATIGLLMALAGLAGLGCWIASRTGGVRRPS
jgi:hypothetical protein